jgi:hypothetical protein
MHLYMSGTWSRRLLFNNIINVVPGNPKMKLLYAYPELHKKENIQAEIPSYCDGVFLDSGAFSVYNSGKTIDIDALVEFCKIHRHEFDVIASLDVIGDWRGSKDNYKYMIKHGADVLPCYHYGEPIKVLDWYASTTDYIGLGGMVGINKYQRRHFLESVFKRYPDNTKVKFHGFGVNDFTLLDQFPFYSVDSAAIVMCAINRQLKTDKGVFYMGEQLYKDKGAQYNDSVREYVRQLSLKYLGGDYMKQLMSPDVSTCVCFLVLLMYRIMMSKQFSSNYTYEHSRTGFDLMEDEI